MVFDNTVADRETKPCAITWLAGSEERFKDTFNMFLGDTYTCIGDTKHTVICG